MLMRQISCFLLLLSSSTFTFAQNGIADTLLSLPAVQINASPLQNMEFAKAKQQLSKEDKSLLRNQSLAQTLQTFSSTYVKNYGPARLATTSVRGGSAVHTAVLWNGLPLQSPILGQVDFALLPTFFFDEIAMVAGSNGAAAGSGAIGGSLELNNTSSLQEKDCTKIDLSWGSYSNYFTGLKWVKGTSQYANTTRLFFQSAKNNFPYLNANGEKDLLPHSANIQYGLLQENTWKIHLKHILNSRLWWQNNDRELPPTRFQGRSVATQNDRALRAQIEWKYLADHFVQQIQLSFVDEDLIYEDSIAEIYSDSKTQVFQLDANWQFNWKEKHKLLLDIKYLFTKAISNNYLFEPTRSQYVLFASYQYLIHPKWKIQIDTRQEVVDDQLVPFTPELRFSFLASQPISLYANVSRFFRLPTFNDWYWPTGDPNLAPENGWGQELGMNWDINQSWELSANLFHKRVEDWIIWLPNGPNFTPKNVQTVGVLGSELQLNGSQKIGNLVAEVDLFGQWLRARNLRSVREGDESKGLQLIYTPKWQGRAHVQLLYQKWRFQYQLLYTGKVYTTIDHSLDLPSFFLSNIQWAKTWKCFRFRFAVNNLWNLDYEVVAQRPMLGRNYEIGIQINL